MKIRTLLMAVGLGIGIGVGMATSANARDTWTGAPAAKACSTVTAMQRLDFWLGDWNVHVENKEGGEVLAGTNRIEKILDGCAISETWTSSRGGEGRSLFYYHPAESRWKQVWVTGRALAVGGLKEKAEVTEYAGPGIRFQGEISLPSGGSVLDRTTLIPLEDGSVRQLIEYSEDDGSSWHSSFDAIYRRRP